MFYERPDNSDDQPTPEGQPRATAPDQISAPPGRSRLGLIAGGACLSALALAGGFVWGNVSGRSEQHAHDAASFAADQQRLKLLQQQDQAKLDAALKISQAGIRSVIGLHFGPDNKLYATVSNGKPGAKGTCQEDFVYTTVKNGNPELILRLPDASGQHVFADIVINGPDTSDAAVRQIEANHPGGC